MASECPYNGRHEQEYVYLRQEAKRRKGSKHLGGRMAPPRGQAVLFQLPLAVCCDIMDVIINMFTIINVSTIGT